MMLLKKEPATCFHDGDKGDFGGHVAEKSNEHYLLWLVGILAVSAIFGFVIGVATFIYTFVRVKAGLSHLYSAICALAFIFFLGTLSHLLTLFYPEGLLQQFIELPWPLQ